MTFLSSKSGRKTPFYQKESLNRTRLILLGDRGGKGETKEDEDGQVRGVTGQQVYAPRSFRDCCHSCGTMNRFPAARSQTERNPPFLPAGSAHLIQAPASLQHGGE